MVHGKRQILATEAEKIRAFFRISPEQISTSAKNEVRPAARDLTVTELQSWSNDVPVLGNAVGGAASGADIVLNGDTGMRVRRPPRLEGRVDIFALFVQGDSMEPRYFSGDLIYLEKARPPRIGDFVVVELKEGPSGDRHAFLKRLEARSPTKLKLRQYNPDKLIEIDVSSVHQVVRVMTMQDLMG
jgi:phage repressor protein C with HTH and peptisase S24 domain